MTLGGFDREPAVVIPVLTDVPRVPAFAHPSQVEGVRELEQPVLVLPDFPQVCRGRPGEPLRRFERGDYSSVVAFEEAPGKKSADTSGTAFEAFR